MGPSRFERPLDVPSVGCCQTTPRARWSRFAGLAAPLIRAGNRPLGDALTTGGRAPRPSGSRGANARGAGSRGSVSSGIRSPPFPCLPSIGAERIERPPQDLQSRMLPLHHAPPNFRAAEHGELSLSIRWEARHGPFRILRGDAGHGIRFQGAGSISMCRRASRCA